MISTWASPPLTPMGSLRWAVVHPLIAPLLAGADVLEVGCGQGAVGARVAALAGTWTGIEIDADSAAVAAARTAPHGGRVLGSLDGVPTGAFDVLLAFEVLEHLHDDSAALAEWLQRVRPGGRVCVSVPAFQDRFGAADAAVGHFRRYEPDQLRTLLADAGLRGVQICLYGWPLGNLLEAGRNRLLGRGLGASGDNVSAATVDARTRSSGRIFQPGQLAGQAVRVGVAPFTRLQRLAPTRGVGLVALGHLPA